MAYRRFSSYEDFLITNAEHGTLRQLSERLDCSYHSVITRRATLNGRLASIRKPIADPHRELPPPFDRPTFFVESLEKISRGRR